MLFTELPFLDRFAAAARAGFEAVEFLFPMSMPPGKLNSACRKTSCSWCCSIPRPATLTPGMGTRRPTGQERRGPA